VEWWVAYRTSAFSMCKGLAVLRPDYVAFIPTEKQVNMLGTTLGLGAAAMVGVHRISLSWLQKKRNIFQIVEDLWDEYRDDFDHYLPELVSRQGGNLWRREECKVTHSRGKGLKAKHGVIFRKDKVEVQGTVVDGRRLERLLDGWQK